MQTKIFCPTCKEEKEWINYERQVDEDSHQKHEIFTLSCGHRKINIEIIDEQKQYDSLDIKVKRPGFRRPIYEDKQRNKVSKKGRHAKELLCIDRLNNRKIHKVWEKDENGNCVLVHDEDVPLNLKKETKLE